MASFAKIDDTCINCSICEGTCPFDAISHDEKKVSAGEPGYFVTPEKCTDCGACYDVCPVAAIHKVVAPTK
ncbi:MAG: 4Fe-4S binding protein [Firmicutes bacterium]|nr:4Fe-4S binding protein [Bacillota bacterium]